MALEIVTASLGFIQQAVEIGLVVRQLLKDKKQNSITCDEIVSRLQDVQYNLEGHVEAADGDSSFAPVWSRAITRRQGMFERARADLKDLKEALSKCKLKRFVFASETAQALNCLLNDVKTLQVDLEQYEFFTASKDETIGALDSKMNEIRADLTRHFDEQFALMMSEMRKLSTSSPAGSQKALPPTESVGDNFALVASKDTLLTALDATFSGPVTDQAGIAARFSAAAYAKRSELKDESGDTSQSRDSITSAVTPMSSRDGAPSQTVAPAQPVTENPEEDDIQRLRRLEGQMTKYLFKLSASSLTPSEKEGAYKMVEMLWGMWSVDVGDVKPEKDGDGQYVEIGEGSYGRVVKGVKTLRGSEGQVLRDASVAIKIVHKQCASKPDDKMKFLREVMLLREAEHPNVVKFMGAHWPKGSEDGLASKPFLVTELMTGSLEGALADGVVSSFAVELNVCINIARGLEHLHKLRIVHQDMKPENILVRVADNNKLTAVRITDFGVSRMLRRTITRTRRGGTMTGAGTVQYMAPEMLLCQGRATCGIDTWSFGLLMAHVLLRTEPSTFQLNDSAMEKAAGDGSLSKIICKWMEDIPSPTMRQLCLMCVSPRPEKRPPTGVVRICLEALERDGESAVDLLATLLPKEPAPREGPSPKAHEYYSMACELYYGRGAYKNGRYEKDVGAAVKWLNAAAAEGSVEAWAHLGYCLVEGIGTAMDTKRGMELLYKAADKGSGEAHNMLGHCFQFGKGYPKDEGRAFIHFRHGHARGVMTATTNVGFCLLEGVGIAKDHQAAVPYFEQAANANHPVALAHLALCHQFGAGVARNRKEAERLYRLGIEAPVGPTTRPPSNSCSAQYMDGVTLNSMKTYELSPQMFTAPAKIRLAAWFSVTAMKYGEYTRLIQEAAAVEDPIGVMFLPSANAYAMHGVGGGAAGAGGATGGIEDYHEYGKQMMEESLANSAAMSAGMQEAMKANEARTRGGDDNPYSLGNPLATLVDPSGSSSSVSSAVAKKVWKAGMKAYTRR